jgi:streptogramin lyase
LGGIVAVSDLFLRHFPGHVPPFRRSFGNEPELPAGSDAIVKIDKAIVSAADGDISSIPVTFYQVPTRDTVMHRITQGPDGALWFTELAVDQVGRLEFIPAAEAAKRPPPQKSSPKPSASLRKRATGHCD